MDTGIVKTEKGDRRVDVDDLVALAVVLGCSPNLLLLPRLPPHSLPSDCELTPGRSVDAAAAWAWATGERPLPDGETPRTEAEFITANRPHHFGGELWRVSRAVSEAYQAADLALSDAIAKARAAGMKTAELRSIFEQAMVRVLAQQGDDR